MFLSSTGSPDTATEPAPEAAQPKLNKALRVAERELGEGEFDECLDAVGDARRAITGVATLARAGADVIELGVPFTGITWGSFETINVLGQFSTAVVGLTLVQSAYTAEIIRGGFLGGSLFGCFDG